MIDKGLVSYIIKKNIKHFKAAEPSRILTYLEEKKSSIEKQEKLVQEILPELELKIKISKEKTEAEIFQGYEGIKTAFNDILKRLNKGDEYYVIGARAGPQKWVEPFFIRFYKQRAKKKIKVKVIINEDVRETIGKDREVIPLTEVRYLPQVTPAAVNTYKDRVIIALWTQDPLAILIKSREVADSFKQYFKVLWKIAKK